MFLDTFVSFIKIALELTILFIVISFVIGLLQGIFPFEKIEKMLSGKNKIIGILFALIFAFVTPFCSCSTIPIVVNMLHKKIPFGIVIIFLFSSPVLDPTILTIMGVLLGWKVVIIYTLSTVLLSVLIGLSLEALGLNRAVKDVVMTGYQDKTKKFSFKFAWNETFKLMKTVYPYLIVGAAIGAILHGIVPTEWISNTFSGDHWWLVPLAAVSGIPLYIRLSSMIPISHVLIMKGMALGPVMAMMISSAGASLPEIMLLKSIFKTELVVLFVLSVITMSTFAGFIFYII
ncbi:permease [Aquibacillus rhizosphaerae]|uniref:Permease n=1 Tax=Aquibacillus rhizosphaerae TaxID=3051431 RepID=A0ABT7L5B3_9BACI|nr:permease [Aquibacillus sp. LR5S19]MDL4841053.1 permease [Aquibacillus sp. LR5S19]